MKLERDVFVALAAIAWADGEVAPEEAEALHGAALASGLRGDDLSAVDASTESPVSLDSLGRLELMESERVFVFAVATLIAHADGKVVEAEAKALDTLAGLLGLSPLERAAASAAGTAASNVSDLSDVAAAIRANTVQPPPADPNALTLPPGSMGWPIIGETLAFVSDPFAWVTDRVADHGPVVKGRVLGRQMIVMTGPEANAAFIDTAKIQREGSMFDHVFALFGGYSLPTLDGDMHLRRKQQVLAAFSRESLERYVAELVPILDRHLAAWAEADEVVATDALAKLSIEAIAKHVLSVEPGDTLDRLVADYEAVIGGMAAVPLSLPGTAMFAAEKARDRCIAFLQDEVKRRREEDLDDGLARVMATASSDGSTIDADGAALEAHHMFLAGYILFAEVASMIAQLEQAPEWRDRVIAEVKAVGSDDELTLAHLLDLPVTLRVIDEVRRITPMLPVVFGKAKKTFAFSGHAIPEGWQVCLGLHASHMDPSVFPDPDRFDPDRFERGEHRAHLHAYCPQGAGLPIGHKCAGADYTVYFMAAFLCRLLRDYRWTLPEQDLSYDTSRVPGVPRDGLRLSLRPRKG